MKRGFSLIEVLLATAILGIGMVVLLTGVSRCLAVMKSAKTYQEAQWTLGLGEVDSPLMATNDVQSLAFEKDYPNGYRYTRTVEDDDDEDKLFLVRIIVTRPDIPNSRREEVVRYVLEQE